MVGAGPIILPQYMRYRIHTTGDDRWQTTDRRHIIL